MSDERKPTMDEATDAAARKYAHWLQSQPPQKPEGITDHEWAIYLNNDPLIISPAIRDKVEAALGWKKDDIADAREIAEKVLGAVKIAEKGHVPEENLTKYRARARMARQLDSLANQASGIGDYDTANALWRMAGKIRTQANELRVDIPREEDNGDHD